VLAAVLCLKTIGLGAGLAITTVLILGSEPCGEETGSDAEVRRVLQQRIRLRDFCRRAVDNISAFLHGAECRRVPIGASSPLQRAVPDLIGSGIRLLC
jgi:hypothetical protein